MERGEAFEFGQAASGDVQAGQGGASPDEPGALMGAEWVAVDAEESERAQRLDALQRREGVILRAERAKRGAHGAQTAKVRHAVVVHAEVAQGDQGFETLHDGHGVEAEVEIREGGAASAERAAREGGDASVVEIELDRVRRTRAGGAGSLAKEVEGEDALLVRDGIQIRGSRGFRGFRGFRGGTRRGGRARGGSRAERSAVDSAQDPGRRSRRGTLAPGVRRARLAVLRRRHRGVVGVPVHVRG